MSRIKRIVCVLSVLFLSLVLSGCKASQDSSEEFNIFIVEEKSRTIKYKEGIINMTTQQQLEVELRAIAVRPVNALYRADYEVRDALCIKEGSAWVLKIAGRWNTTWSTKEERDVFVISKIMDAVYPYGVTVIDLEISN